MKLGLTSSALGTVLLLAAEPSPAHATDLNQQVQLTFDGSLLEYRTTHLKLDASDGSGSGEESSSSATSVGLLGAGFGVGIGYAATNSWLVGVRVQANSTTESFDSSSVENSRTEIGFLPRVEYVFPGGAARPYLAGIVGFRSLSQTQTGLGGKSEASGIMFEGGAAFGVHGFLLGRLSIDPAINLLGYTGSLSSSGLLSSADVGISGIRVLVSVGLSGWLSGKPTAPKAADVPEPEPSSRRPAAPSAGPPPAPALTPTEPPPPVPREGPAPAEPPPAGPPTRAFPPSEPQGT